MNIFWQLVLQFVLIGLNAFFACAEIAVLSVNDARLAQMIEQGDKKAIRLSKLINDSSRFLATIQVAITLSGFFGSALAADNFAGILADLLYVEGGMVSYEVLHTVGVVSVTLILSYFTLVLGELVPKRLAMKNPEKLALSMSGIISTLTALFRPIVALLSVSTNGVLRLLGVDPNADEEPEYEEDIKDLVDQGSRMGEIDSDERAIIHNLFAFDDISVGELATHRTEVSILYMEDSMEEWHKTIVDARFSHYPVCGETADDVIGVLSAKDYYALEDRNRKSVVQSAVHPAHFVPEGVRADVLFKQMKKDKFRFAVVMDEYGGFSGIATMNDLLSQIVGEFDDEAEETAPDIVALSETEYEIRGSASLDEVAKTLEIELPLDEYDTFGGYIMGLCGAIPDDGETLVPETGSLLFTACTVENHRVLSARIVKKEVAKEIEE